ncbi:putative endo-beta-1,4-glucanase D [Grifola frondosa]|uniref:lytic cellulose monooxygenase (C4-dehydrogenating) n=1 Tax=Grifola frondosa TaxID=5627 RepID=A0A1C7LS70_GRIFR|nr:putative endo-beta-1,4-glucanase D [Grifola frondosa]
MKAIFITLAAVSMPLVAAHYTLPDLIANGSTFADCSTPTDPEIRCYELDMTNTAGETSIATVQAGSTIGFKVDIQNDDFYHPGYFSAYMSEASPAANSAEAGTGSTWFKVWEDPPVFENGALVFPSQTIDSFTFTIPKSLPSGQYLVRGEQIALHVASTFGGAQYYIGCAQINVVNGGSGNPDQRLLSPGHTLGTSRVFLSTSTTYPRTTPATSPPVPLSGKDECPKENGSNGIELSRDAFYV